MKTPKQPLALIALFCMLIFTSQGTLAQGIELTVGYPYRIAPKFSGAKVNTLLNANVGLNFNVYIRSVFLQFGVGYQSNNYTLKYNTNTKNILSARVKHNFIYVPVMAYTSFYEDNSRIISGSVGMSLFIPFNSINADIYYVDGSHRKGTGGRFNFNVCPKAALRYTQYVATSLYVHTELYTEIAVFDTFKQGNTILGQEKVPGYQSRATIGLQVGLQYVFPIKEKTPRFFESIE